MTPQANPPQDAGKFTSDASTLVPQITLEEAFSKMEEFKAKQTELAGISERLNQARQTINQLQGKEETLNLELATLRDMLQAGCPRALALLEPGVHKPATPTVKAVPAAKVAPEPDLTEEELIPLTREQAIQVLETFQDTFSLGNFRKKVNKMLPGHGSKGVPQLLGDLIERVGEKKAMAAEYRRVNPSPA